MPAPARPSERCPPVYLREADHLAHAAIQRLDAGEHALEPERAAALRAAVYELRGRIRRFRWPSPRWAWFLVWPMFLVAMAIGGTARTLVPGPWYGRFAVDLVVVGVLATGAGSAYLRLYRRWRELRPAPAPVTGPVPPEDFTAHAERLVRDVLDATRRSRRWKRPTADHLAACAARVWALTHGCPVRTSEVDAAESVRLRRRFRNAAQHAHVLVHQTRHAAATAGHPAELVMRTGRYAEAWRLLRMSAEHGLPRRRWIAAAGIAALTVGWSVMALFAHGNGVVGGFGALTGGVIAGLMGPNCATTAAAEESASTRRHLRAELRALERTPDAADVSTMAAGALELIADE